MRWPRIKLPSLSKRRIRGKQIIPKRPPSSRVKAYRRTFDPLDSSRIRGRQITRSQHEEMNRQLRAAGLKPISKTEARRRYGVRVKS